MEKLLKTAISFNIGLIVVGVGLYVIYFAETITSTVIGILLSLIGLVITGWGVSQLDDTNLPQWKEDKL